MSDRLNDNKINDSELNSVAGGAVFDARLIDGSDKDNPFEIIDAKGDVRGRYSSMERAMYENGKQGLDYGVIDWNEVCRRRNNR